VYDALNASEEDDRNDESKDYYDYVLKHRLTAFIEQQGSAGIDDDTSHFAHYDPLRSCGVFPFREVNRVKLESILSCLT